MISFWQAALIGLVVVATQLDGQVLGECKLREPIVTGFLVGLILGDVTKGLIIGAQMQLMWMGATAIGPTAGLDIGTGGTIGVAVALATNTGVESAIMFGVPVSVIMQFVNTLLMTLFSGAMLLADREVERLNFKALVFIHLGCTVLLALMYWGLTFMLMFFGSGLIDQIVGGLPDWMSRGLNGIAALLPALGFALLMRIIMNGSLWAYFILGFIPAAFVGTDINMVGMAAVALAIAIIIFQIRSERSPRPLESNVYVQEPNSLGESTQSRIASDEEWED
ncbi:PTS sugar transporter subunit IIC [Collinsella sp. AGMB00827]|uniref:PTS sugar transporter subunit IIC n=1 Tax=Collinsella ureilytica TaxID=2869515 RepID=A0ABS7MI22_9ACTN|nr:PTS sugar transporter subunit IIC [Collinsella urealyticum]MBY4797022.1 PTS sugar transporter subunit IIC [Collinsella urealyticum]